MNETEKVQLLEKFPEIISLVSKVKSLSALDKDYYRDNLFMTLLANTTSGDREAMGTLTRLSHKFNILVDDNERDKASGMWHKG